MTYCTLVWQQPCFACQAAHKLHTLLASTHCIHVQHSCNMHVCTQMTCVVLQVCCACTIVYPLLVCHCRGQFQSHHGGFRHLFKSLTLYSCGQIVVNFSPPVVQSQQLAFFLVFDYCVGEKESQGCYFQDTCTLPCLPLNGAFLFKEEFQRRGLQQFGGLCLSRPRFTRDDDALIVIVVPHRAICTVSECIATGGNFWAANLLVWRACLHVRGNS